MKIMRHRSRLAAASILAISALLVAACGGSSTSTTPSQSTLSGAVVVDGSSTVAPLSSAAAERFQADNPDAKVTVGTSGTGGGFTKFCNGETDISDASRPIKDEEKAKCTAKNIKPDQIQVANDALTVVVNKDNTWATCLTVPQLKKIWEPGSKVNNWNEVDPSFPNEPLKLFGAGADSGTFDYFTQAINGKEKASRTDYSPSENDNVTVQGVTGTKGAMGYFGFSYFEENQDKLKALEIDGGAGCVAPSAPDAQSGKYKPLARPLFIYPADAALKKPQVLGFVTFYLANLDQIIKDAKFIAMTDEQKKKANDTLASLKTSAGV